MASFCKCSYLLEKNEYSSVAKSSYVYIYTCVCVYVCVYSLCQLYWSNLKFFKNSKILLILAACPYQLLRGIFKYLNNIMNLSMSHCRFVNVGFEFFVSEVARSCPTLCDPMDCSLLGFSVHGIFQARVLEWVAIASPGDLPDPAIGFIYLDLLYGIGK